MLFTHKKRSSEVARQGTYEERKKQWPHTGDPPLIFAFFGLFLEIKFRETFNKDVIRENKFREILRI